MHRTVFALSVLLVLFAGCSAPAAPLQEDETEPSGPRKTLPTFVPRADAPQAARQRPMTTAAGDQPDDNDPVPTTSRPASTTSASPTTTGSPSTPSSPRPTSPTPSGTATPTSSPTASSNPSPTATSSPSPSPSPTSGPDPTGQPEPSPSPSPSPSQSPSASPSPQPPQDGNIRVAAAAAKLDPGFSVDIQGAGTGKVGDVRIGSSFGTVSFENETVNTYTYERIPWTEFEYTIYQGLGVREDSWLIVWFYCQEESLQWVYYETTHGQALAYEAAQGTCQDVERDEVDVSLPATNMTPPVSLATQTIDGERIHYAAGSGWIVTGGRNWTMYPFQVVDCTIDCGSPGWYELHVVLWNQTGQRAAFGILYLRTDQPDQVSLLYGLRLPTLVRTSDTFDAVWTA